MEKTYNFNEFMEVIRRLRAKDGCPWDREQTHESLKQCLIDECYEVIEAINNKDYPNLCEELGDVLLQVAMHSVIAEEDDKFTIEDVISEESKKMVRRHPHVFGNQRVGSSDEVLMNWDDIKRKEKKDRDPKQEILDVPKSLPANIRAEKVQKKAVKFGLNLGDSKKAIEDINVSLIKLNKAIEKGEDASVLDEFGLMLFRMIKLSLVLQLNAEYSLTNATNKFINRLIDVISPMEGSGDNLYHIAPEEQESLWR